MREGSKEKKGERVPILVFVDAADVDDDEREDRRRGEFPARMMRMTLGGVSCHDEKREFRVFFPRSWHAGPSFFLLVVVVVVVVVCFVDERNSKPTNVIVMRSYVCPGATYFKLEYTIPLILRNQICFKLISCQTSIRLV